MKPNLSTLAYEAKCRTNQIFGPSGVWIGHSLQYCVGCTSRTSNEALSRVNHPGHKAVILLLCDNSEIGFD